MLDVQETTPLVKQQLSLLWTSPMVQQLTACLPMAERQENNNPDPRKEMPGDDKNLVTAFKKALGNSKSSKANQIAHPTRKPGSPEVTQVALVASMYQTALTTLTQMRMDILTGNFNLSLYILTNFFITMIFISTELQRKFSAESLALYQFAWAESWIKNLS